MAYTVTPSDFESIEDVEIAFGADRLLPNIDDIPEDFHKGNLYTKLAEALFYGSPLPDCQLEFKEGFNGKDLNRAVRAHLQSFSPKHDHKIAGVGYMISKAATLC